MPTSCDGIAPAAVVEAYRAAFERKDLATCVGLFDDDATIRFLFSTYRGKAAIEEWHAARFAAEVEILSVDGMKVDGEIVELLAAATSAPLRRFRIPKVKGKVTFRVREGRITEARFAPRAGVASHMDWQFR